MKAFIRTAKEFDLDEVCQHLLVAGDLLGDCFNCREIGLNYTNVKVCPKCNNEFRYITSRKPTSFAPKIISMLHNRRPDLVYIELEDVKQHKNRDKARDFLS